MTDFGQLRETIERDRFPLSPNGPGMGSRLRCLNCGSRDTDSVVSARR